MEKENQGISGNDSAPSGRGFSRHRGSIVRCVCVGVFTARKRSFNNRPRAVKHRLDEPGQIIPQHGCVPALPASVSPGSGNFSRKPSALGAAQNQASVIAHRGAGSQATVLRFRSGEKYFLDIPLYRSGFNANHPKSARQARRQRGQYYPGILPQREAKSELPQLIGRIRWKGTF